MNHHQNIGQHSSHLIFIRNYQNICNRIVRLFFSEENGVYLLLSDVFLYKVKSSKKDFSYQRWNMLHQEGQDYCRWHIFEVENVNVVHLRFSFPEFYQSIDKERICIDEDRNQLEVQVLCTNLFSKRKFYWKKKYLERKFT